AVSPPDNDGQKGEASPAKGEISLTAAGRGFTIQRAYVRSNNSDLTITGTIDWNARGSLTVNFKSSDMAEVQRAVDAFGFIPQDLKETYAIALEDTGEFTGHVEGKLSEPSVTGHLKLSTIKAHDEVTGSLEGD